MKGPRLKQNTVTTVTPSVMSLLKEKFDHLIDPSVNIVAFNQEIIRSDIKKKSANLYYC